MWYSGLNPAGAVNFQGQGNVTTPAPLPQAPSLSPYSDSLLLTEIHNYFPALLYNQGRFNSTRDVFRYINEQMSARYNIFSAWQNYYQRVNPPVQQQPRTPRPRVYVPRSPNTTRWGAPVQQQMDATHPLVTALAQEIVVDQFMTNLMAALPGNSTLRFPRHGQQTFLDPVVVRPSDTQIAVATTVLRAPAGVDENCAICQDRVQTDESLRRLNACNHQFHRGCIDTWFQRNVHCPVCRHDIRIGPTAGVSESTQAS